MALAAVLALDPPVLVLDEVLSRLDSPGKKKVTSALQGLRREFLTAGRLIYDCEGEKSKG